VASSGSGGRSREVIRAAGGVVWRESDAGMELALIHRPRYDDWSLPKGKLHVGEKPLPAALREVAEEIGSSVAVTRRLGRIEYLVAGVRKTVDYWGMRHMSGSFTAGDEVDELRWLAPRDAMRTLTYDHDRAVVAEALRPGLPSSTVVLVRHAKAGKRAHWHKDDRLRPLESAGREQARRLVPFLAGFGPEVIVSADRVRCVQTVQPVAELLDRAIEQTDTFADEAFETDPEATLAAVRHLAVSHRCSLISSQGDAIPGIIDALELVPAPASSATRKAAVWVVSFRLGRVISADYYGSAPAEMG